MKAPKCNYDGKCTRKKSIFSHSFKQQTPPGFSEQNSQNLSADSFFTPGYGDGGIPDTNSGKLLAAICSDDAARDGKSGENKQILKNIKHRNNRRGNIKGKNKNKSLKFSLFGTNANGLSGKLDSLNSAIKFFQSTKLYYSARNETKK